MHFDAPSRFRKSWMILIRKTKFHQKNHGLVNWGIGGLMKTRLVPIRLLNCFGASNNMFSRIPNQQSHEIF